MKASQSADVRPTKMDEVSGREGRDSSRLDVPGREMGVLVDLRPPTTSEMRDIQLHRCVFRLEAASSSAGFPRVPRGGEASTSVIVSITGPPAPPAPASASSCCFS